MEYLQLVIDDMGARKHNGLTEAPKLTDLSGFGKFLQNLKNQGMHPWLTGDFPAGEDPVHPERNRRRPYLVK